MKAAPLACFLLLLTLLTGGTVQAADLTVWHRTIASFNSEHQGLSAEKRAEMARERLMAIEASQLEQDVKVEIRTSDGQAAVLYSLGDEYLFTLYEDDVPAKSGLGGAAEQVEKRLQEYLSARLEQ